jgi:hypothetical protein
MSPAATLLMKDWKIITLTLRNPIALSFSKKYKDKSRCDLFLEIEHPFIIISYFNNINI